MNSSIEENQKLEEILYFIDRAKRNVERKDRQASENVWNQLEAKVKDVFLMLRNPEKEDLYKVTQNLTEKFLCQTLTWLERAFVAASI